MVGFSYTAGGEFEDIVSSLKERRGGMHSNH